MLPNDFDIKDLFRYIKRRIHNYDYCNNSINVIDIILEFCDFNDIEDDDFYEIADMIRENKLVYEFIEVEARKKRQLIRRDYVNNKNLNEKYMINKTSLLDIFRRN